MRVGVLCDLIWRCDKHLADWASHDPPSGPCSWGWTGGGRRGGNWRKLAGRKQSSTVGRPLLGAASAAAATVQCAVCCGPLTVVRPARANCPRRKQSDGLRDGRQGALCPLRPAHSGQRTQSCVTGSLVNKKTAAWVAPSSVFLCLPLPLLVFLGLSLLAARRSAPARRSQLAALLAVLSERQ